MRNLFKSATGILLVILVLGCGKQTELPKVWAVSINKSYLSLIKGESEQLSVRITPTTDATERNLTWSSSDPKVVTVNQAGLVTALKSGSSTITVRAGEKSATCSVTVTNPIKSLTLDYTSVNLEVGNKATLIVTISPADADETTVQWNTSDDSVALVENGTITAVAWGGAVITAKVGDLEATCTVSVTGEMGEIVSSSGDGVVAWVSEDKNSAMIMSVHELSFEDWEKSNDWCENYGQGWRMPTIDELTLIHLGFDTINKALSKAGFTTLTLENYCHWSSTVNPYYSEYYYRERLHDGKILTNAMSDEHRSSRRNYTRAVKSFSNK